MIQVIVERKGESITSMEVEGHALFDKHGSDIVCAGVSSVMVGLLNALSEKTDYHCEIDEVNTRMSIQSEQISEAGQLICEVGLIQLQTIANQFPKNIQIREVKL